MEYRKNQILDVEITDMSENGEGIGKVSGYTLFVKDAVIGDVVKARLTKVKKNYSYARLEEIVTPSKYRVKAPCPISRQCGGCQIQSLDYNAQLAYKEAKVINDLVRIGGFDKDFVESIFESIIGMDNPYRYRNKAQYPVGCKTTSGICDVTNVSNAGKEKTERVYNTKRSDNCNSSVITGFYAGRTHSIIENDDCLIGCEENKDILNAVISYMNEACVSTYDETTGKGVVRHILIRKGFTTGEIMVCLIINVPDVDMQNNNSDNANEISTANNTTWNDLSVNICNTGLDKYLKNYANLVSKLKQISGMTSISININNKNTNVIMGDKCVTLWGSDTVTDYIGDVKFKISPLSFFQVNPVQTKKLYEKALEYADLKGDEIVWDLYCGIGTVSLFLARRAKKVYGVEIVGQAILDAKENAKINGIENVEFITGAAENVVLPELPDIVVVDPPRKGCDEALLDTILRVKPSKIVYISCNPSTLSRDLKYLTQGGKPNDDNEYHLEKICPVDQFPHTIHIETVCLLSKLKSTHHIEVEVSLDEMDLTKAESKATYSEIKEYVKEHFGFQVTNLSIAQVKREFGIIERKNYHVGEGKAKVPKVIPEKREAIIEALKYFQMIE